MGQLLDLVRLLKLDTPEALVTPTPTDFVGPIQPPPEPAPLTGWRGVVDRGIDTVVGGLKGLTGVGDQGPAGMTATNAGQVLGAAMPLAGVLGKFPRFAAALEKYHTPGQAPFYSRLDDAVGSLNASAAPAKVLSVAKGATTAEEVAARKLPEFVAGYGNKPVPKAALVEHLAAHPVTLDVKTLGGSASVKDMGDGRWIVEYPDGTRSMTRNAEQAQAMAASPGGPAKSQPKFSQYQVPGGTNYKETLITLPQNVDLATAQKGWRVVPPNERAPDGSVHRNFFRAYDDQGALLSYGDDHEGAIRQAIKDESGSFAQEFRSSHFDEPNIVVHTRSNDRTIPELGKGTFLEEVQSDWHQKGKASGYKTGADSQFETIKAEVEQKYGASLIDLRQTKGSSWDEAIAADLKRVDEAYAAHQAEAHGNAVPNAPFKDTWPDLALKHHLADAAQNPDTHWLGFTSGETQAARYDLSKSISRVEFDAGDRQLRAFDLRGKEVIAQTTGPENLADYIGKEAAEKLLASTPTPHPQDGTAVHRLSGLDLKVGGEGMHAFYDNLLPKRLQKIIEKYGGKVERLSISGDPSAPPEVVARYANQPDHPFTKNQHIPAWIVRLTPEIKARILKEGIPLFTGAVLAGAASQQAPGAPQKQTR